MTSRDQILWLSLRPRFADLILDGSKTVELRRIRPRATPGTPVFIYAASPVRALLGTARVAAVASARPDEIWDLHSSVVGLARSEFDDYFNGTDQAVAIQLEQAMRLPSPISLHRLRETWADFQPPQSFRYLSSADVAPLAKDLGRSAALVSEHAS